MKLSLNLPKYNFGNVRNLTPVIIKFVLWNKIAFIIQVQRSRYVIAIKNGHDTIILNGLNVLVVPHGDVSHQSSVNGVGHLVIQHYSLKVFPGDPQ